MNKGIKRGGGKKKKKKKKKERKKKGKKKGWGMGNGKEGKGTSH